MTYTVNIKSEAYKDIERLRSRDAKRIDKILLGLEDDPRPHGCKKLVGSTNQWRIRIGNYRVLYAITESIKSVEVFRVLHRKDAYRR